MSDTFVVASILGLAFTVNALRPVPGSLFTLPSFFAAWLTAELAPHLLVVHVATTAAAVATGRVTGTAGWVAGALSVAIAAGLTRLIVVSQRSREVVERALCDGLGADYQSRIAPHRSAAYDLRVPWRQLVLPFRMRHPSVLRTRNIPYGPARRRNLLDVYHHRDRPAGAPVLLQIHGGGWVISNKDQQGKPLMLHLASKGWVCVAPNYRLSPRATWPDHIVDIKLAIRWIRDNIHEFGGDPGFIVITGGSAGGHLASLAALTANEAEYQPGFEDAETGVAACVSYYGVYDLTNEAQTAKGRHLLRFLERLVVKQPFASRRDAFERASPQFRVTADAPPFLVIHGAHDSLVPVAEARRFADRLRAVTGEPVVYAELPGTQHAFDVFPSIRTAHVIRAVERFCDYVHTLHLRRAAAAVPPDERPLSDAPPAQR